MVKKPNPFRKPHITNVMPGPVTHNKQFLPVPPPAGTLPPDDSRLWVFVPKAVQQGEAFIQEDTREWFADRDFKVQVCRSYPDHPRWLASGRDSLRVKMHNSHIISEIHMLARTHLGLPDMPPWVAARMSVKQQQADLAYRLTKSARDVFLREGKLAIETFASKAPGQFIKWVSNTFIAKQIEQQVTVTPGGGISPEEADNMLEMIAEELRRRADDAQATVITPLDYVAPERGIVETMRDTGDAFHEANKDKWLGGSRLREDVSILNSEVTKRLGSAKDIISDQDEIDKDFWG